MPSPELLERRATNCAMRLARGEQWLVTCVGLEFPVDTVVASRILTLSALLAAFDSRMYSLSGVIRYRNEDGSWLSGASDDILCTPALTTVYRTFLRPPTIPLPIIGYLHGRPYHIDLAEL
jgi:hypothetical protein